MRPYFAIIKDSFRAAMASRVLYVLLILITLLLIVLSPFHIRETLDWELTRDVNVRNPDRLVRRLVERHNDPTDKPIARIWELLPEKTQKRLLKSANEPDSKESKQTKQRGPNPEFVEDINTQNELIRELNNLIENRDFYRPEDWNEKVIPSEAESLIDQGVDDLPDLRVKRLNRLLISTAVTPLIDTGDRTAIDFHYAVWRMFTLGISHQMFAQTLTSELPVYFDKFVMSIGLLIAIVITANMVPETFEPGSLNLLLSKPISRWGLYTSKFIGGCVFIGLCACYLFLGIWLWLGIQMQVWDRAILFSVPLYIIVFAIYFSVSAFVGLIWRSAIVSVILTLLFWAFCFTIGSVFGAFNTKMKNSELIALLPVEDRVFANDVLHQFRNWDENENQWNNALEADLGEQGAMAFGINSFFIPMKDLPAMPGLDSFLAPIHDAASNRILASRYEFGQAMGSGKKTMFVADADELEFKSVGKYPRDTLELFGTRQGIVAATADGAFYRLDQEKLEKSFRTKQVVGLDEVDDKGKEKTTESPSESLAGEVSKSDNSGQESAASQTTAKKDASLFDRIGPKTPTSVRSASHVDYSATRDEFAIYQRGTIKVYRAEGDQYQQYGSLKIDLSFQKNMTCRMAFAGDTIVMAFGNGKVITVDAANLKELNEYQPESRSAIEVVVGSPDGTNFGVLYRNGNLWILKPDNADSMQKADVIGQGEIGTLTFGSDGELWVSDNTDRATRYDATSGNTIVRHAPSGGWIEKSFRYAIRPLYRVCPKPGEFYKVVTHLSSSGDTSANENVDLNKSLQANNPFAPLRSGLAFMVVMVAIGCLYFQYKDF